MQNLKGELSIEEDGVIVEATDLLIEHLAEELGVSRLLIEQTMCREIESSIYTSNRTRDIRVSARQAAAKLAKAAKALPAGRPHTTAKGRKHAPRALLSSRNV
jgi:hypothetical protein